MLYHRSRRENLSRAIEHESNGNPAAAYECYQKAVDISPSIAYDLIQVEMCILVTINHMVWQSSA